MSARKVEVDPHALKTWYEKGWTLRETAQAHGCSPQTVWRRLKALLVPMRKPGDQGQ